MRGKVVCRLNAQFLKTGSITSADAPHLIDGIKLQGLDTLFLRVNHTTMTVPLVFLGKMRSHLGQCLVRGKSDTDRNTHALSDSLMKVFTPSLQIQVFHAIHIDEAFVNGIAEIGEKTAIF